MEKKISKLFDYQRFEQNKELAEVIAESESRFAQTLSDDDLFMVAAAGESEIRDQKSTTTAPDNDPLH